MTIKKRFGFIVATVCLLAAVLGAGSPAHAFVSSACMALISGDCANPARCLWDCAFGEANDPCVQDPSDCW